MYTEIAKESSREQMRKGKNSINCTTILKIKN